MKALKFVALLLVVAAAFGGGYVWRATRPAPARADARKVLYWVDPMHPAYRSDRPGIAPDCGMELEPVFADEAGAPVPARKILYYRDPADPSYTADKAGLNPATGHTLEPVYAPEAPLAPAAGTVRIPTERQQLIGLRFATVDVQAGARTVRAVGKVAFDETRVAHVHTRFEGWIEKVLVDFTGELVRKGQPMLTVYSPEMLASQEELLLAVKARDLMRNNPVPSAAEHGETLVAASKRRLELWGLGDEQVEQVLRTGQPIRDIVVRAPASGVVLVRNAFPNQKVTPDSDLYTIADLSRVWILADVFESDVPNVKFGDAARVTVPALRSGTLTARVDFVQPQVDPMTRTVKVRLDLPNPGSRLKPDMFVDVEFSMPVPPRLTVPAEAVLDTGERQTVFVDLGNGYLKPRQVRLGDRLGDRVAVLSGLAAGERVVASGTFLLDAESQLKAAAAGLGAPSGHAGMPGMATPGDTASAPKSATPATPGPIRAPPPSAVPERQHPETHTLPGGPRP